MQQDRVFRITFPAPLTPNMVNSYKLAGERGRILVEFHRDNKEVLLNMSYSNLILRTTTELIQYLNTFLMLGVDVSEEDRASLRSWTSIMLLRGGGVGGGGGGVDR